VALGRELAGLLAGLPKSYSRGVLADGSGEAAKGPASAGSAELAFQPCDGGQADSCSIGERLLRYAALAT
jgi:hypothetical protein